MARFVFRLEPLLTARRHAEQDARRVVAVLERERLDLEGKLRRHQQQIMSDKQQMRGSMTGSLDMTSLRQTAGVTLHVIRKAHQVVLQLAGTSQRMESARSALLKTMTRRRAIELLREKRFDQWKIVQSKAEIAALDELAVGRAARRTDSETHP
ncbi:MAG: flagellar export protein FliJ [Planctomycetota bacterium]|nr:MAG: flagellar export protein FliJ [Planctomycetota bacterium]